MFKKCLSMLAALIAVFFLSLGAFIGVGMVYQRMTVLNMSAWAKDLPAELETGDKEFKNRLVKQFPADTPEQEMVSELEKSGFKLNPARTPGWKFAELAYSVFPCHDVRQVFWQSDEDAKIMHVRGVYWQDCE